ncbi:MAG: Phosphoglycolate phosphatase [Alphaproteobacteria bacterium MarineAlpha3_Bin4]|nr:MAG: Phosphoglycolate phosphatase [Alphaproteobacteria bacterium MarineAlpha3_Bin4]
MTHGDRGLKPQAVLFDWDNTLVDSWPIIHDALNTTFRAFGLRPWTLSETRQKVRHSMRDNFPKLFGDRWEVAGEVFYKHYGAIHAKKLEPTNGAEEMLHGLSVAGIYLGIVSNKKGDFLRTEAAHLGWDRYFGGIVDANDAKNDKPAGRPGRPRARWQRYTT